MGVACGEHHSLAVDDLGMVYAWGRNREGQCGQGAMSISVLLPQRVDALLHERVVKVVAGSHQSFAITDDGKLYRWGLFHEQASSLNVSSFFFLLAGFECYSTVFRAWWDERHLGRDPRDD